MMLTKQKIKDFYTVAVNDLGEMRNYVYFAVVIYVVGLLLGVLLTGHFEVFLDSFRRLATKFIGRSLPVLIAMIFLQNFFAAFVSMWAGALLGLVPLAAAATNGILLGVVLSAAAHVNLWQALLKLMPHGIFEMPAVFIAWGLGMWRGAWIFRRRKDITFRERALGAYRIFFAIVVPLLVVAAVIEGLGIWFWRTP